MSYLADKQDTQMDGRTDTRTDAGNDNTRRPKLDLGKKTIGNPFHAPRSWVCDFMAIREFRSELPYGKTKMKVKLSILWPMWP